MIKIFELIKDILYPRRCLICSSLLNFNSQRKWLCDNCKPFKIARYIHKICEKCGRIIEHDGKCIMCNEHNTYYDKGYILYEYSDNIRKIMIKYKFRQKRMYSDFFAEEMTKYFNEFILCKYDYICCVPIHKRKMALRGYNQSELVALNLSKYFGIKYMPLLVKVKNTKQQSRLSAREREQNVKDAFDCTYNLKDKSVLIIDDVLTTGYTINECCKMLKKAEAQKVDFIVMTCASENNN